jgi:transposase
VPRSTRHAGAWIEKEFGLVYESARPDRASASSGLEYHKPSVIPHKLDEERKKAFIASYEKLMNSLGDDEAELFADAVHPTHPARPASRQARAAMALSAPLPDQAAFHSPYYRHLNPIERLWGAMHKSVKHNKCYATCAQFAEATLELLHGMVPRNWGDLARYRQFSRDQPQEFSGCDVNRAYL